MKSSRDKQGRAAPTGRADRAGKPPRDERRRRDGPGARSAGTHAAKHGPLMLYGRHAIEAALTNPRRRCRVLQATEQGIASLAVPLPDGLRVERVTTADLADQLPPGAPHQGLALQVAPLPALGIDDLDLASDGPCRLLVLDQVTDPQNVGAIMRTALAFGVAALITQDRHSPPETGALAKAASGALDRLAWVRAPNLSKALDTLAARGFWRVGLAGEADRTVADVNLGDRLVVVMGSEGEGLRPLTARHCDVLARIPISDTVESLNVGAATAVALYALGTAR